MRKKRNDNGFAISSILYPAFVLIITIVVSTLVMLLQSSFSMKKLISELQGNISDNNTMKSMKDSITEALYETKGDTTVYTASYGVITYKNSSETQVTLKLNNGENTTNWVGKFFTNSKGVRNALITNGTYCAYITGGMSGVAVYNAGECEAKLGEETGCTDVINFLSNVERIKSLQTRISALETADATKAQELANLTASNNNKNTQIANLTSSNTTKGTQIATLQTTATTLETAITNKTTQITNMTNTANSLQSQINTLNSNNTDSADFLKSHPAGSIYITTNGTNPESIYGGSWSAYGQGRVLVSAGSSYGSWATGGEYTHRLSEYEMPSHNHNTANWYNAVVLYWDQSSNSSGINWGADPYNGNYQSSGAYTLGTLNTGYSCSSGYHNNVQPYVAVYMWYRNS